MVSAMLLVGGLTLYVALLVTEPVAHSLYFALLAALVSATSWLLLGNVSILTIPMFLSLALISITLNIRRLRRIAQFSKLSIAYERPLYTMLVLGSGGHTKELLYMLSNGFKPHSTSHRRYLISSGDRLSLAHLETWEAETAAAHPGVSIGTYDVVTVPRARRVHQSLSTAPFTVIKSLLMLIPALLNPPAGRPELRWADVIVSNGPATGFCAILAAYMMRVLGVVPELKMRSLYVESWARISTLSVTGKLFRATGIADRFVVQHDEVATKYGLENGGWLVLGGK